jgi:hypothetical protein
MAILSQKDKKTTLQINKKSINEKEQAYFFEWCSEKINVLKLPHVVWQSFLSIFPHLSGETMSTSQTCCHLPGELSNSVAECADRAQIDSSLPANAGGHSTTRHQGAFMKQNSL